MKRQSLSILAFSILLAGCCCDTPAPVSNTVIEEPTTTSEITPGSRQEFTYKIGDRVYFAFDKSHLSHDSEATLKSQAEWLAKYPQYKITIVGKCDERGSTEYNLALGERRARAAFNALTKYGIDSSRISVCSEGKESPVVVGNTEEAYAKNRTAISIIAGGAEMSSSVPTAPAETNPESGMMLSQEPSPQTDLSVPAL